MAFKDVVKKAFIEWKDTNSCKEAVELNNAIGTKYFDTSNPHFFVGDINSELVLVHLNPKRNKNEWNKTCEFSNFDDYWEFYTKFGNRQYGIDSDRKHRSPFDHKQIRFLRPFNILPINDTDKFLNLENVIDRKLQLELMPYGSPDFSYTTVGVTNLKPFIDRLLPLITQKSRSYIIFCGRVFQDILKDEITYKKEHRFRLTKNDGTLTKSEFQVINIRLRGIKACIAPQFAKQGYPVEEYGKMVKHFY